MVATSRSPFAALLAMTLAAIAPAHAQQPAKTAPKTPESALLSPEDTALRHKLQPFIRCLNGVGTSLPTLVDGYHHAFTVLNRNPKAEFSKMDYIFTQQYTGMVFQHGAALACADALASVPTTPPADAALDALATRYSAGLRQMDAIAPKVEPYYNQQNYKDDGMAAGRAMDAEYEPVLKELSADTHTMFQEVQQRTDTIDEHRVDAIAAHDGKRLRWQTNAFMVQARVTMRTLDRLVADGTLSKGQVTAAITPLEARFEATTAYFAAHPEENTDDMTLWDRAHQEAEDFVTDLKTVRRAAADDKPAASLVSDIADGRHDYNRLIGAANTSKR